MIKTSPPTANGGGAETKESIELPSNLQEATGELCDKLLMVLKEGYVSATLDLPKLKLCVADRVVNLPAHRGKLPKGSVLLQGDWAIFRRCDTSDDKEKYELDVLWITSGCIDLEDLEILTGAASALFHHSELEVTYRRRKAMKNWGYRWSPQADKNGQTINLHCVHGKVAAAEEAVAACLMTKIVEKIVQPVLPSYLLRLMLGTLNDGGNVWNTRYPYTVNSMTVDYENDKHKDNGDEGGSAVIWLHDCRNGESIKEGFFVINAHGVHAEPRPGTMMYLNTAECEHYSLSPTQGAGQLGIAFAVKKAMLTRFCKLQASLHNDDLVIEEENTENEEPAKKKIKKMPAVVGKEHISQFWRNLPGMKRFLDRFIFVEDSLISD